jgi:hypothetical protein
MRETGIDGQPKTRETQEESEYIDIIVMSPRELKKYLINLEKSNELETFLQRAFENDAVVAVIFYWRKWYNRNIRETIERVLREKNKDKRITDESLPLNLENKFTEDELHSIFSNLIAIQLNSKCPFGCPLCGFDAVKKTDKEEDFVLPFAQLKNLFNRFGENIGQTKPILYWASDPSSYFDPESGKRYKDVHELTEEKASYSPHITTRETEDSDWADFLQTNKGVQRFSIENLTHDEVIKARQKTGALPADIFVRPHDRGLGVSFRGKPEDRQRALTPDKSGVLLTPHGLYGVLLLEKTSEKFPQGIFISPIDNRENGKIAVGQNLQELFLHGFFPFNLTKARRKANFVEEPKNLGIILVYKGKKFIVVVDENCIVTNLKPYSECYLRITDDITYEQLLEMSKLQTDLFTAHTLKKLKAKSPRDIMVFFQMSPSLLRVYGDLATAFDCYSGNKIIFKFCFKEHNSLDLTDEQKIDRLFSAEITEAKVITDIEKKARQIFDLKVKGDEYSKTTAQGLMEGQIIEFTISL